MRDEEKNRSPWPLPVFGARSKSSRDDDDRGAQVDFVTLSDNLFSASDLRLMELELLCTLRWNLSPPTVHLFVYLLISLFEPTDPTLRRVERRALRYADHVRSSLSFVKYPASMIAVAAIICSSKYVGIDMSRVSNWMRRVHACRLSYTELHDAVNLITCCGRELMEANLATEKELCSLSDDRHPSPVSSMDVEPYGATGGV